MGVVTPQAHLVQLALMPTPAFHSPRGHGATYKGRSRRSRREGERELSSRGKERAAQGWQATPGNRAETCVGAVSRV